jgi:ribosomal-protein-alanine N-acetyltransferase
VNGDALAPFPVVESQRLRMRALEARDADAVFAIFANDEVTRFYDRESMRSRDEAVALVARLVECHTLRVGIRWAITTKEDGALVGTAGFNSFVSWANRAVIGYDIARAFWGHGYATEAIEALVSWGHSSLGLHRIEALVMLGNDASVAVLRKTGFVFEGVLRGHGRWKGAYHDMQMFAHVLEKTSP